MSVTGIITDSPGSANTKTRQQFNKLVADVQALLNGTMLITAPGLRIGTTAPEAVKFDAFTYQIAGMRYVMAAGESPLTATTHDIADPDTVGREATFRVSIAAAAAELTFTKSADAALGASVLPALPANHCAVGSLKVAHNGSAIFDATTDALSAAHITDTYADAALGALTATTVIGRGWS